MWGVRGKDRVCPLILGLLCMIFSPLISKKSLASKNPHIHNQIFVKISLTIASTLVFLIPIQDHIYCVSN